MHKYNYYDDSSCCTVSFQIKHRKREESCSKASYHMFYDPKLKWNIQQRHLGMWSQLRQPHSPISPHVIKPLLLPPAPGQSSRSWAPSAGKKVFPSSLWFIQYLANLALNLPHEISSHFSPPLPAYVNYMPPQPSSIPTCFFSLCFRNSPAWRMRNRPREGGSGSLSAQRVGPPHPVWVTHWSQCAALSWVHRRAFTVRWDSNECLWGLSGSQRAVTIPAFTATLMGSLLVVWACFKLG